LGAGVRGAFPTNTDLLKIRFDPAIIHGASPFVRLCAGQSWEPVGIDCYISGKAITTEKRLQEFS
jgi:hypothetical protein